MCKLQSLEEKWVFFDISVPYYLNNVDIRYFRDLIFSSQRHNTIMIHTHSPVEDSSCEDMNVAACRSLALYE